MTKRERRPQQSKRRKAAAKPLEKFKKWLRLELAAGGGRHLVIDTPEGTMDLSELPGQVRLPRRQDGNEG